MDELLQTKTTISEEKHLSWKVAKFASLFDVDEDGEPQMRPPNLEFKMGNEINLPTNWRISLEIDYVPGYKKAIWMNLELLRKPDTCDGVMVAFCVKIKNKNGKGFCYHSKQSKLTNMADMNSLVHGITHFLDLPKNSDLSVTEDGSLIFEIHVNLYSQRVPDLFQHLKMFQEKFTKKQQSDMAKMLSDNWSCPNADSPTKIVCKDGVELVVNRGILSARSPVFLAMFQHETKEVQSGVVEIKEISSWPMKVLLHFLYTGVLQDNWSSQGIVEELLYAASKYEQDDLVEFMDETLGRICTEENVGKLVNLAKKLNMKKAKEEMFKFINLRATDYDKLESMMRDAIVSDLYMVPVANGLPEGSNNDSNYIKK